MLEKSYLDSFLRSKAVYVARLVDQEVASLKKTDHLIMRDVLHTAMANDEYECFNGWEGDEEAEMLLKNRYGLKFLGTIGSGRSFLGVVRFKPISKSYVLTYDDNIDRYFAYELHIFLSEFGPNLEEEKRKEFVKNIFKKNFGFCPEIGIIPDNVNPVEYLMNVVIPEISKKFGMPANFLPSFPSPSLSFFNPCIFGFGYIPDDLLNGPTLEDPEDDEEDDEEDEVCGDDPECEDCSPENGCSSRYWDDEC